MMLSPPSPPMNNPKQLTYLGSFFYWANYTLDRRPAGYCVRSSRLGICRVMRGQSSREGCRAGGNARFSGL